MLNIWFCRYFIVKEIGSKQFFTALFLKAKMTTITHKTVVLHVVSSYYNRFLENFLFFSDINETSAFGDLWGSNQTIS